MQQINKNGKKQTVYPCRNKDCKNTTCHNGALCIDCYKTRRKSVVESNPNAYHNVNKGASKGKRDHRKLYPCKNNCGKLISKRDGLCINCYNIALHKAGEKRQLEINKRKADTEARLRKDFKPMEISICPSLDSPNQRHFEVIDTNTNIGKCKYCGRIKDYKVLLQDFYEKV